jgi:hypothetical protein
MTNPIDFTWLGAMMLPSATRKSPLKHALVAYSPSVEVSIVE